MDNQELINKYEDASIEYIRLLKEILIRFQNKELSNDEWERVMETASRRGANILDILPKCDKKILRESIESVINTCSDDNR